MSNPRENAPDKAARLGLILVEPLPNEIFVDLDNDEEIQGFRKRINTFMKVFRDAEVSYTTSSGGGIHAYISVPDAVFSVAERIALQAALGSDCLREIIAIDHYKNGYAYPSVFFENPGAVRRQHIKEAP